MLLIMVLVVGIAAEAGELKPLPDLKPPSGIDQKQLSRIETIGLDWWLKNRGLLAEESLTITGYFSTARPIAQFSAHGDRIWEARINYTPTASPTGILWINDRTGKVLGLGVN